LFLIFVISEERLNIMKHNTSFTYRSTITINNVQKSDAQNYTCTGKSRDIISNTTSLKYINYKLVVHGNYNISVHLSKIILSLAIFVIT